MKNLFLFFLAMTLSVGLLAQEAMVKPISVNKPSNGKSYLTDYYQQTYDALERSIAGLTPAQFQFKPAPDKWSVSQCLEHIVLTEKALFDYAKKGMDAPANPEKRKEVKASDEDIINGLNDRSHKATATADLIGQGKYVKAEDALKDLTEGRKTILTYLNTKSVDDLRSHVSESPFGAVDGFHSFLFLAAHTSRHTAQIVEVKADKQFPK
jgi:hypothetical protein